MKPKAVVVGAGAFGGWTALFLRRHGWDVILADSYGPGNSRSSSGGETRALRLGYGGNRHHFETAREARLLWLEEQKNFPEPVYFESGCLWFLEDEGRYLRDSFADFIRSGVPLDEIPVSEMGRRFPEVNTAGLQGVFIEREAGFIKARRSCAYVVEEFVRAGGRYVCAQAAFDGTGLVFSNGERPAADAVVLAAGSWLPKLLPRESVGTIRPSRQEVFFFGAPAGRCDILKMPVWINLGKDKFFYGLPDNENRGFKVADDTRGATVDPDDLERRSDPQTLEAVRTFAAQRFPILKGAPLLEARVCQYENSADLSFVMGRVRGAPECWIVGGGSGHGFKHGPAVGKMMAEAIASGREIPKQFDAGRFLK